MNVNINKKCILNQIKEKNELKKRFCPFISSVDQARRERGLPHPPALRRTSNLIPTINYIEENQLLQNLNYFGYVKAPKERRIEVLVEDDVLLGLEEHAVQPEAEEKVANKDTYINKTL